MTDAIKPSEMDFPWKPKSTIRGNLTLANFRNNFSRRFALKDRLHAETLMVAVGAAAGFSAQNAARLKAARLGIPIKSLSDGGSKDLFFVDLPNEQKLFYGEFINEHLLPVTGGPKFTLWNFAAGGVISSGISEDELPAPAIFFDFVKKTIEAEKFGNFSVPANHAPHIDARETLRIGWNYAQYLIELPMPQQIENHEPLLNKEDWPIVIGFGAGSYISMVKDVLSPLLALSLVMEAAIIASKLDFDLTQAVPYTPPVEVRKTN